MAGPGSTFTGPLVSGPIWNPGDTRGNVNTGLALLTQTVTLTQNGTSTVTVPVYLPSGSQITTFNIDTTTAWNSGTSDALTIGLAAAGTDFVSSTSVATAGRASITYTAAQLAAMLLVGSTPSNGVPIYITVTPTGTAASAGSTTVTVFYIQTVQLLAGAA
jgi:hypothetical protein